MRILFLIDNLRPGGAQKALLAIVRALRAAQADPRVWCLGGSSEFENEFRALGVPVLGKPRSALATLWAPAALLRYLRRERIELLQTFLFHSDVAGRVVGRLARIGGGKRRLVIVSSVRASNVRNRAWQFRLARWTAPLADAFTAVSRRTLEFASQHEGVAVERATVIPNGIDPAEWEAAPDARRKAQREELGLQPGDFVVCTVGRLHEQKGLEFLLPAARTVAEQVPNAVFLIAGYGPLRERLEAKAKGLGLESRVRFLGYRRDVANLLAASDIFALPSLWEGMSNAILEAMAAAKPVVATAVDGAVEQVEDGVTGLLVPPGDAKALAGAILELARDPRKAQEMGTKGREKVRREFTLDRMTEAYFELYRTLLEKVIG